MPPSEMTATSVVPPPMSTTMLPVGSWIGSPAPIAAAIGSSMMYARRAPRRDRRFLDRALLHPGDAGGDADDHARLREETALVHLLDEVAEHLLRDVEVGDDAVLQGTNGLDVARRAADHALGLGPDGEHGSAQGVDRDHGRLVQDDATTTHVDERVRRPEVDGHIATKEPEYPLRPLLTGRGGRRSLETIGHGLSSHSTGVPGRGNLCGCTTATRHTCRRLPRTGIAVHRDGRPVDAASGGQGRPRRGV